MVNMIGDNIAAIRERIRTAEEKSGRSHGEVRLMGVSKFHTLEEMLAASEDVDLLGENRVQEAIEKRRGWPEDNSTQWHLIGHLQRNKVRKALEVFSAVESVDTFDLARAINVILAESERKGYPVFVEVNTSGEATKSGVAPQEAEQLVSRILKYCPAVSVEGLMTIGPNTDDISAIRRAFESLRELRESLRGSLGIELPELSMGMSGDYEAAIEEGSTIVRIGTGIFGPRDYK